MGAKLVEKRNEFEAKQKKLHEIFEEAKTGGADLDLEKVTKLDGTTAEKAAKIRQMNEELDALGKEIEDLVAIEKAEKGDNARQKALEAMGGVHYPTKDTSDKNFGQQVAEAIKGTPLNVVKHLDVELKTLFETSAGWAPESIRSGKVVLAAERPIQVIDILPTGNTDMDTYKFMEETTFTNNAAEAAEGAQYGEAALELTERSQGVETIGVWLPVTDRQMEDVAGIESYVNQRLQFMIRQRLDYQLLQGDGVTPNILGIYNKPSIQTQAKGADPTPDAFYKAMTKIMVTGQANPSAFIMHPNDWQEIRLLRTTDGVYIWGNPSEPGPDRMWGLPVAKAQAATEGTGIAGDFAEHSMFFTRRGIDVQVTNAHSDYFIKGKKAIRADFRGVLVIFRAPAICTVTGI